MNYFYLRQFWLGVATAIVMLAPCMWFISDADQLLFLGINFVLFAYLAIATMVTQRDAGYLTLGVFVVVVVLFVPVLLLDVVWQMSHLTALGLLSSIIVSWYVNRNGYRVLPWFLRGRTELALREKSPKDWDFGEGEIGKGE